jgi:hypothetical protein
VAAECAPARADNDLAFIECVVDVTGDFPKVDAPETRDTGSGIRSPRTWKQLQDVKRVLELGCEEIDMDPILNPPRLLTVDVITGRLRESHTTRLQRVRSSVRICSASTRRPAAISAFDAWRAS